MNFDSNEIFAHSHDTRAWTDLLCLPKLVIRPERGGQPNSKRSSNDMRLVCEQWLEGARGTLWQEPRAPSNANPNPLTYSKPPRRRERCPWKRRARHDPGQGGRTPSSRLRDRNGDARSPPATSSRRRGQKEAPPGSPGLPRHDPFALVGPRSPPSLCARLGSWTVGP